MVVTNYVKGNHSQRDIVKDVRSAFGSSSDELPTTLRRRSSSRAHKKILRMLSMNLKYSAQIGFQPNLN